MPTLFTIAGAAGPDYFTPPDGSSGTAIRDAAWLFYRKDVAWAGLQRIFAGSCSDSSVSPAMFRSDDGGATWTGPINQDSAPVCFNGTDGTVTSPYVTSNTGGNFDIRMGAGLNPDDADHVTVCMVAGSIWDGDFAGEKELYYCDFDFGTQTWGAPYGAFHAPVYTTEGAGYSSQPGSSTPVFWYSDNSGTPHVEGAAAVEGLTGYGVDNLVVGPDGTAHVLAATHPPGDDSTGTIAPNGPYFLVGPMRISGDYLVICSAAGGPLALWSRPLAGGAWEQDAIPGVTFLSTDTPQPYLILGCCGDAQIYWLGSDGQSIWRSVKAAGVRGSAAGTGWSTPAAVYTDPTNSWQAFTGCRNPVLGGTDIALLSFGSAPSGGWSPQGGVFAIHVADTQCLNCNNPPAGNPGVPYSHYFTACVGTGTLAFAVTGGALPDGMTLDSATGTVSGTPTTDGVFSFTVTVTADGVEKGSADCSITINDSIITPPPPALDFTVSCPGGTVGEVGALFTYTVAPAGTGGLGVYSYSWDSSQLPLGIEGVAAHPPPGITFLGTPGSTGGFAAALTITDTSGSVTVHCPITVVPAVSVECPPLTAMEAGVPYSTSVVPSGGFGAKEYVIASGALPAGLSLDNSTGAIAGTPTTPGGHAWVVEVTDELGGTASVSCSISVAPAGPGGGGGGGGGTPPVSLHPGGPCGGCACNQLATIAAPPGVAFTETIAAYGGVGPYTFTITAGSLPSGLSLNSATGVISGTPTGSGPFAFTILVTDSLGATDYCTQTINVPCIYLDLWVWALLPQFTSLTQNVDLPMGYERALKANLAVTLASSFNRPVPPDVAAQAIDSAARLSDLNWATDAASEDPPPDRQS